jgi:hypothetical protein
MASAAIRPVPSRTSVAGSGVFVTRTGTDTVTVCTTLESEFVSWSKTSIGKLEPAGTKPSVTSNKPTVPDVVPFGIKKSVAIPRSVIVCVTEMGSKPKKLKKKMLALRSVPELFVTVPLNVTVPPLVVVSCAEVSWKEMGSALAPPAAPSKNAHVAAKHDARTSHFIHVFIEVFLSKDLVDGTTHDFRRLTSAD